MQQIPINEIAKAVYKNATYKDFNDNCENESVLLARFCNRLQNTINGIKESWEEEELHSISDKSEDMVSNDIEPLTNIDDMLSDVIIHALDICLRLKIDPQDIIMRKHMYNIIRPCGLCGKRM